MTHAGTITVGVDIDAGDLGARLAEAVRRQIEPLMAQVQNSINETNGGLRDLNGDGLRDVGNGARDAARGTDDMTRSTDRATQSTDRAGGSRDRLTASTRRLFNAQDDYNGAVSAFGQRSLQAEAAHRRLISAEDNHAIVMQGTARTSRSTSDSQISDLNRLADAADNARRRRNAAQDEDDRRSKRSGSDLGGKLKGALLPNALALGANALPGAALAVTDLAGAIQQLGQAGLVLPAVFSALGASFGVAKIATSGLGDALKELDKSVAPGATAKQIKAASDALSAFPPAVVETARAIETLKQGPLKDLKTALSGAELDGVGQTLTDTVDKLGPRLTASLSKIASAQNGVIKQAFGSLSDDKNFGLLDNVLGDTAEATKRATGAIDPIIHAFATLASTGGEFLPRLGDALTKVADRFDGFISKAGASGQLFRWIDEGLNGARAFGDALLNLGKAFTGLTKANGAARDSISGDGGLLGGLEKETGKLAAFTNSVAGQDKLKDFFAGARDSLHDLGNLLREVLPFVGNVVKGFAEWGAVIHPILEAVLHLLNLYPGAIQAVVVAFLAFKSISAIASLGTAVEGLGTKLSALPGKIGAVGGALGKLGGARGIGGLGLLTAGVAVAGSSDNAVETGGGILAGAAGGALAGSVFGPEGTIAGAAIGGAISAISAALNANAEAQQKASDAVNQAADDQARYAQSLANTRDVLAQNQTLQLSLNQATIASHGTVDENVVGAVQKQIENIPTQLGDYLSPDDVKAAQKAINDLGVDSHELATEVSGTQPQFDALIANLQKMGVPGQRAADALKGVRDGVQYATTAAQQADPALQTLANTLGVTTNEAADKLKVALNSLPHDTKLDVTVDKGLPAAIDLLKAAGVQIDIIDGHPVVVNTDSDSFRNAETALEAFGVKLKTDTNGNLTIGVDQDSIDRAAGALNTFSFNFSAIYVPVKLLPPDAPPRSVLDVLSPPGSQQAPPNVQNGPIVPGHFATGGAIYGGTRGVDSVPAFLMPDEHVLTPSDVAALGGQAGTYRFRAALQAGLVGRFADGGAGDGSPNPFDGPLGPLPGPDGLGGDKIDALIAAVNAVRDAVLATGPNATAAAQQASSLPGGRIDPSGISTPNTPYKATNGSPLSPEQQAANKSLTTALKPLTAEINDAIKKGTADRPGTPLDDQLLAARQAALDKNRALIDASGPAGSSQQADFIQKNILGPLAAALNNTAKNDTPAKALAKVGLSPDDPLVKAILAERGAFADGQVPVTTKGLTGTTAGGGSTANPFAPTGLPAGAAGVNQNGEPVDANGVPLTDIGQRFSNGARAAVGLPVDKQPFAQGNAATNPLIAALLQSTGQVASTQAGNIIGALSSSTDIPIGPPGSAPPPNATLSQLELEHNPEALAAALGLNVPDYTRNGGGASADKANLTTNTGPGFQANGEIQSDSASLINRTLTDQEAAAEDRQKQLISTLNQVKDALSEKVLAPIVQAAVTAAFNGISDQVSQKLGTNIGAGAAPPIADAVRSAIPDSTSGSTDAGSGGASSLESGFGSIASGLFDEGGILPTNSRAVNLSGSPERVLSPSQTVAFDSGLLGGWSLQPQQQHFAAVEGQSANDTLGADFFGASQVPILGAILNFLIQTLLKVIGVTVEARDTLALSTKEVRQFRGDFQKFDASGRLTNDTSGLLDRSQTSQQEVVDERIRILQQVIQGIVKYIIEQIITPITKAVTNAAISAGAEAAGGGITAAGGGPAGGIVSSLISSAGQAGADAGIQIGSDAAEAAIATAISSGFGIAKDNGGDLTTSIFGGDILDNIFSGLSGSSTGGGGLTSLFSGLTGLITGSGSGILGLGDITSIFSNLLGGGLGGGLLGGSGAGGILSSLLGGGGGGILGGGLLGTFTSLFSGVLGGGLLGSFFDEGGVASGVGLMPKATLKPERVLSPAQTTSFDRLVQSIEGGHSSSTTNSVHAPIHLHGSQASPEAVRDRLMELMT